MQLGLKGKFVVGYIGTHGMAHGLETVLTAAKTLQDAGEQDIAFLMLGDGACKSELERVAGQQGIKNVEFVSSVGKNEVVRYWSILDASVIHLKNEEAFAKVIPSKLFECMGMGIPVLHGVKGESADIVEELRIGLTFEPENSNQMCKSILKLREDVMLRDEFRSNCTRQAGKFDRKTKAIEMLECLKGIKSPSNNPESKFSSCLRWAFWLNCLAVVAFSLLPPNNLPSFDFQISWEDKLLHGAAFLALCMMGSWSYLERSYSLIIGLLALGGAIEISQYATGWRHMEVYDFVANAAGILVGRGIFRLFRPK